MKKLLTLPLYYIAAGIGILFALPFVALGEVFRHGVIYCLTAVAAVRYTFKDTLGSRTHPT